MNKKWKTISIPETLNTKIEELAYKIRVPKWAVIEKAVALLESFENARKRQKILEDNEDKIEKVSWYILKLTKSLGAFHENPTSFNLDMFIERLEEVEERVLNLLSDIDENTKNRIVEIIKILKKLAKEYLEKKDRKVKKEMNDYCKLLVKLLILSI